MQRTLTPRPLANTEAQSYFPYANIKHIVRVVYVQVEAIFATFLMYSIVRKFSCIIWRWDGSRIRLGNSISSPSVHFEEVSGGKHKCLVHGV